MRWPIAYGTTPSSVPCRTSTGTAIRSAFSKVANGVEMPEHESLGKAILDLADTIPKTKRARRGEPEPSDDDDND